MSPFCDIAETFINLNVTYMGGLGMDIYSINMCTNVIYVQRIYIMYVDMLCALREYFYKVLHLSWVFVPRCQWGEKNV